jgi:hypothetical protein
MVSIAPGGLSAPAAPRAGRIGFALAGLGALGIVFGDIGTSPLYTLKTIFDYLHGGNTPDRILGILSLVMWTLFLITSVKYVTVAMSIDNDGEGGILALMSLLGRVENVNRMRQNPPRAPVSNCRDRYAGPVRRHDYRRLSRSIETLSRAAFQSSRCQDQRDFGDTEPWGVCRQYGSTAGHLPALRRGSVASCYPAQ